MKIQPLHNADLPAVTRVHCAAYPTSSLTQLGQAVVYRYYAWQLQAAPQLFARGISEGANLAGFCFGGTFAGALSGFLRRNRAFLIRQVLARPWLVFHPLFRERLREGLGLVIGQRTSYQFPVVEGRSFGILSIAVDPHYQRRGIGAALLQDAEALARTHDYQQMNLSVEPGNLPAIALYESQGWIRVSSEATWAGFMLKRLS